MKEKDYSVVLTGRARATYLFAFKPYKARDAAEDAVPKYKVTLMFRKDKDDISRLRKAEKTAITKKWGDKPPKRLKKAIRDGDGDDMDDMYAGHWVITASSETKPELIDTDGDPLTSQQEVYSGIWCKCDLKCYGYDRAGSKGVTWAFNSLIKLDDGKRMDGRRTAAEALASEKDDDDNDLPRKKKRRDADEDLNDLF